MRTFLVGAANHQLEGESRIRNALIIILLRITMMIMVAGIVVAIVIMMINNGDNNNNTNNNGDNNNINRSRLCLGKGKEGVWEKG